MLQGKEHTAEEKTAWDQIVDIANRFIAADRYLLAVPMWNAGIPYPLKHYIDVIHQPFEPTLLTADPEGDFERAKGAAVALADVHGRFGKS